MNILALFNGIGGLPLSCERADIKVDKCYYSEIDKFANKVMDHHYPNAIALGDVTKWREWDIDWASIDIVGAGFPCQSWSVAGQQLGDKDERGMLFWTTLEIIKYVLYFNPKAKFLMENVRMKKDFEEYITHHTTQALGYVEKTLINSALVSAQNRQRYYWTNFKVEQPQDKGILLKDILEDSAMFLYKSLSDDILGGSVFPEQRLDGVSQTLSRAIKNGKNPNEKSNSLTACAYKGMQTNGMTNVLICGGAIRGRYIVDGKRQDHKMKTAGFTEQRLEIRKDEKTNTLTTVQKDNVVVFSSRILCRATVQKNAEHTNGDKSPTLTAAMGLGGGNVPLVTNEETGLKFKGKYIDSQDRLHYRKLTPTECARLQTRGES